MAKRSAHEAELDLNAGMSSSGSFPRPSREMQGAGCDGKKHSLDSDEEDDTVVRENDPQERLNEDDIEGQEDDTVEQDDGVKITPFNLKEEQEEGHFSKDGAFVWKKEKEIQDAWLDNVDWVKVKEMSVAEKKAQDARDEAEDEAEAAYDETDTYKSMLALMREEESVAKAIRRLAGGGSSSSKLAQQRQRKIAQKLKKKAKLTGEEEAFHKDRQDMEKLTGFADSILSRSGNMEIYEETYEKIAYMLKQKDQQQQQKMTVIPEGTDDDDALDMFASNLDEEKKKEKEEEMEVEEKKETAAPISLEDEVKWEFRWEDKEDAEIHGPHSSEEMLKWQESGFFDKGVFVRKVGDKSFLNGKRVDFDLYI